MLEITAITILLVLILIFLMLRAWSRLITKTTYPYEGSLAQEIFSSITIEKQEILKEEFSVTNLGLSKKFKVDVILEIETHLFLGDNSEFYHGDLNVITYENVNELLRVDNGYILNIMCTARLNNNNINLFCSNESYDFIKKQILTNKLICFGISGIKEKNQIKAREIEIFTEESFASSHSLRKFVERYKNNADLLKNSYLSEWLEHYRSKFG